MVKLGDLREHLGAGLALRDGEGARREVGEQIDSLGSELADGIFVVARRLTAGLRERAAAVGAESERRERVPRVLANGDADAKAADGEDRRLFAGLEVAIFVEDVVGRQKSLVRASDDLALSRGEGGVVEGAAFGVALFVDRAEEEHEAVRDPTDEVGVLLDDA